MERSIRRLQKFINNITSSRLKKSIDLFELKAEYWDDKTLQIHIKDEIYKASCELVTLHEEFPILHIITNFPDMKNVLWESTFLESLLPNERKMYRDSELLTLNFDGLESVNTTYDEQIPYFSGILLSIYLTQYIAFLQSNLPKEQAITIQTASEHKFNSTFDAHFTSSQIELLTKCVNDARVFQESISIEILKKVLSCTLDKPLKARNNRLLVYFFSALDDRSQITRNWQSVIDKNRLFLSSGKGNPLTQTDLSSANSEIKITPPKDSEIIDKYLKELQKH